MNDEFGFREYIAFILTKDPATLYVPSANVAPVARNTRVMTSPHPGPRLATPTGASHVKRARMNSLRTPQGQIDARIAQSPPPSSEVRARHWNTGERLAKMVSAETMEPLPALSIMCTEASLMRLKEQCLVTLAMLFTGLQQPTSIYSLLSNGGYINNILSSPALFANDDLVSYYVSLLKMIAIRLQADMVPLVLFNRVSTQPQTHPATPTTTQQPPAVEIVTDFPLLTEAIRYFRHPDQMIRIGVRVITLRLLRLDHDAIKAFFVEKTMVPFLSAVCHHIRTILKNYDVDEVQDWLAYLADLASVPIPQMMPAFVRIFTEVCVNPVVTQLLVGPPNRVPALQFIAQILESFDQPSHATLVRHLVHLLLPPTQPNLELPQEEHAVFSDMVLGQLDAFLAGDDAPSFHQVHQAFRDCLKAHSDPRELMVGYLVLSMVQMHICADVEILHQCGLQLWDEFDVDRVKSADIDGESDSDDTKFSVSGPILDSSIIDDAVTAMEHFASQPLPVSLLALSVVTRALVDPRRASRPISAPSDATGLKLGQVAANAAGLLLCRCHDALPSLSPHVDTSALLALEEKARHTVNELTPLTLARLLHFNIAVTPLERLCAPYNSQPSELLALFTFYICVTRLLSRVEAVPSWTKETVEDPSGAFRRWLFPADLF
ncbi:FPL family protein [Carpediemonas membranifera]|uniref:FPL family protein n=1 Tax=Carpediemonas membranifera TaxID=201153 RepID=A0A8J6BZZ7_9EUKA|nr:FPL family protein [Carpediemonas membranifera]|eukprot:KAG9396051.1 FPL family protein [Carpediemonas membranifera]